MGNTWLRLAWVAVPLLHCTAWLNGTAEQGLKAGLVNYGRGACIVFDRRRRCCRAIWSPISGSLSYRGFLCSALTRSPGFSLGGCQHAPRFRLLFWFTLFFYFSWVFRCKGSVLGSGGTARAREASPMQNAWPARRGIHLPAMLSAPGRGGGSPAGRNPMYEAYSSVLCLWVAPRSLESAAGAPGHWRAASPKLTEGTSPFPWLHCEGVCVWHPEPGVWHCAPLLLF